MFKLDSSLQKPLYKQVVDETKKLIHSFMGQIITQII